MHNTYTHWLTRGVFGDLGGDLIDTSEGVDARSCMKPCKDSSSESSRTVVLYFSDVFNVNMSRGLSTDINTNMHILSAVLGPYSQRVLARS